MLRILMSAQAIARWSAPVTQALNGIPHQLVTPQDPQARAVDIGFVTRDVTGLSTKHEILPDTLRFYDTLRASGALRWVHIHSAGADRPVWLELIARGVAVSTSAGNNAAVVAQTALLGLLALARQWPQLFAAQHERRWAPLIATGLPRDLQGQTAVIVGWGAVGREIGRLLQLLGLRVRVVRSRAAPDEPGFEMVPITQLARLLPGADWLLLACALTEQTRGLIGEAELALLPTQAALINVARGEVVDETALISALRAGRLAGAYLDVFVHEPLPPDSPLWQLPNVIATPHSAGFSDGNEQRVVRLFVDNLARWIHQRPLVNQVGATAA